MKQHSPVAQLVEQHTFNVRVAGSNPVGGTILQVKDMFGEISPIVKGTKSQFVSWCNDNWDEIAKHVDENELGNCKSCKKEFINEEQVVFYEYSLYCSCCWSKLVAKFHIMEI